MFKNTSKKHAIALATVAAICTMAGLARADDGGLEDYNFANPIPVAYMPGNDGAAPTCQELREAAWFIRELERTDGDVAPEVKPVNCHSDIYAESTVDAD